ncbi:unnamed protein product [Arctia plantaginis]|uniref:Oxidoreductase-like domain-containing protein n=1 Tax=Arctia plantaginis TaxID=874455 RepID=A0A8S1AFV1_ARCPL|nr:unnamed protein product [Arctia plantaginis]CAB3243947.1 unnamed protein product [Arctia plantaginis]
MEKPVEPNKEDCCNSGCNPCIFDIYEKQLKIYEQYLQNGKYNPAKDNEERYKIVKEFGGTLVIICFINIFQVINHVHEHTHQ